MPDAEPNPTPSAIGSNRTPRWTGWCIAGIVTAVAAVNIGGGVLTKWLHWWGLPVTAWVATIVLLIAAAMVLGRSGAAGAGRTFRLGVLIDQRNKVSLSRAQMAVWWLLVVSTVLTEGIFNAIVTDPKSVGGPLQLAIPTALGGLIGLSAASAVGSPAVLAAKEKADVPVETREQGGHDWQDLFRGDDTANADCIDGSKLQHIFLTLAVVLAYAIGIGRNLAGIGSSTAATFPPLDAGFVGLMAASHAAYLGYKALPQARLRGRPPLPPQITEAADIKTDQAEPTPAGASPASEAKTTEQGTAGSAVMPTSVPPPAPGA